MRKYFTTRAILALAISLGLVGTVFAMGPKAVTEVGVDASQWFSDTPNPAAGYFPIGGDGQLNGEFVIVTRDGIEIGLRATDRTDGTLPAGGKKKGVYEASTGYDTGTTDRAEWNYDWHMDLRGSGTTLEDYEFTLVQTFSPKLNGSAGPLDLKFPTIFGSLLDNATLYQSSQNPVFFNDTFDVHTEGTYNLKLTLKPKNGGSPMIAQIKVIVSDE
jgi:hypothetical protein